MIERAKLGHKFVFSCVLLLTTDIRFEFMHAEGFEAVQMLRMKSNSDARSCPRELLHMVFADIALWNCGSVDAQVSGTLIFRS